MAALGNFNTNDMFVNFFEDNSLVQGVFDFHIFCFQVQGAKLINLFQWTYFSLEN